MEEGEVWGSHSLSFIPPSPSRGRRDFCPYLALIMAVVQYGYLSARLILL